MLQGQSHEFFDPWFFVKRIRGYILLNLTGKIDSALCRIARSSIAADIVTKGNCFDIVAYYRTVSEAL
jgi:hypothetical protein